MNAWRGSGIRSLPFSKVGFWRTGKYYKNVQDGPFLRSSILSAAAETFPLEVQETEESFDFSLIASLEIDVVPHLGDDRVSDHFVAQLAMILHKGSLLYKNPMDRPSQSPSIGSIDSLIQVEPVNMERHQELGSTDSRSPVLRERFSYWCFDLLFLVCSNTSPGASGSPLHYAQPLRTIQDQEHSRRRLAALSIPSLLNRCRTTLVGYVADEALRGNLPFPRLGT